MKSGETLYLSGLKKITIEQIEKDFEEMGMTIKELTISYLDKQIEMDDKIYNKQPAQMQQ